jgi:endonuclease/exonuclease/phosphatase family metal-dependent hydrolase
MLVRVVTVYRPVYSMGATSTYQQQKRHLLNDDFHTCPRDRLLVDLSTQIKQSNIEGNKLIVMGDFNEDIRSSTILRTFQALNMREAIISIHGTNAPNTFYNGKALIDGIFVSQELSIQSCVYTPTKWGMSTDHRLLWIDIEEDHLFGSSSPPIWKPQARRLKTDDPRVVYRFLKTLGRF